MGIVSDGARLREGAYLPVESNREHESPHGMCTSKNPQEALVMLRAENACGESDTFVEAQDAVAMKLCKDKHPDVIPIFKVHGRLPCPCFSMHGWYATARCSLFVANLKVGQGRRAGRGYYPPVRGIDCPMQS